MERGKAVVINNSNQFHSLRESVIIYPNNVRNVFLMTTNHLYTLVRTNMTVIILAVLASLIIICGGIAVYLAEHEHQGANITNLGDSFWWAVVTIATVGCYRV